MANVLLRRVPKCKLCMKVHFKHKAASGEPVGSGCGSDKKSNWNETMIVRLWKLPNRLICVTRRDETILKVFFVNCSSLMPMGIRWDLFMQENS